MTWQGPGDFLERVDILAALGEEKGEGLGGDHKVMVSNCAEFHKLARYLFRYTKEPVGVTLGVPTLREIFEEKYYANLEGGLLERGERVGLLAVGAMLDLIPWALGLLAIGSAITVAQRFSVAYRELGRLDAERSSAAGPGGPV